MKSIFLKFKSIAKPDPSIVKVEAAHSFVRIGWGGGGGMTDFEAVKLAISGVFEAIYSKNSVKFVEPTKLLQLY